MMCPNALVEAMEVLVKCQSFIAKSEIRAGQSRIRQHHSKGVKADSMGASIFSFAEKQW